MIRVAIISALLLGSAACSLLVKQADNGKNYKIRYVNVAIIFNFLVERDKDALEVKQKKAKTVEALKNSELKMRVVNDPEETAAYLNLKKTLEKINQDEEYYKKKLLSRINSAVKSIAEERNIDYVLQIGEEVIFARKENDITEDVIREIARLEKRSAPITR